MKKFLNYRAVEPPLWLSALPIASLLGFFACIVIFLGADAIADYSHLALLGASVVALALAVVCGSLCRRGIVVGFRRSARQILPAVPMLVCIAMVATTWMLSGVVPTLVDYGIRMLSPSLFLFVTCVVCGVISVLTGSSWSTIATIGLAFMGIGAAIGVPAPWVAGAIISGAYFGDKVSPLSDTTVVASSACGVDLFKHIKYLMITAIPSMTIAIAVFLIAGFNNETAGEMAKADIVDLLDDVFVISPYTLVIPCITIAMIVLRAPTIIVLFCSAMLGLGGIFVFQPGIVEMLSGDGILPMIGRLLWGVTEFNTGNAMFDELVGTSGITGMLSTVALVLCAMLFGTIMIGTGMLSRLTGALTAKLRSRFTLVAGTVGSGLFINACTADQYLSLIIGGNMYRNAYRRYGLEPRLLSRTLEDSVSVTSVLIPWNSCGVTQSAVLGVPTVMYLPYCIFNYLSPLMSLAMAFTGYRIKQHVTGVRIQRPSLSTH